MRTNIHHLFWPKSDYKTPTERQFRELPCNKTKVDIRIHVLLHTHQQPPVKPKHDAMAHVIHRHISQLCACFKEKGNGPS